MLHALPIATFLNSYPNYITYSTNCGVCWLRDFPLSNRQIINQSINRAIISLSHCHALNHSGSCSSNLELESGFGRNWN